MRSHFACHKPTLATKFLAASMLFTGAITAAPASHAFFFNTEKKAGVAAVDATKPATAPVKKKVIRRTVIAKAKPVRKRKVLRKKRRKAKFGRPRANKKTNTKTKTVWRKKANTARTWHALSAKVNGGRVGIISGGIGGTYIRIATDLASVLNKGAELRILPIVGQGSVQNITDILYLKGVDVGIVQSDVLAYIKARGLHYNIESRINYITKLYNEEFHLVGGREIEDIRGLEGKVVNFGVAGSGTFMTATTVFEKLGIKVKPVSLDQALALEKLRNGEIAATVYVVGKPARAVADLKGAYGLQLIPVGYDRALQDAYLPAKFTSEDYPELIPSGEAVDSIAVGAVMAVYNWPSNSARRRRVDRFIDRFFSRIAEFRKEPRHRKWREVNLAANLPGWNRFGKAERWLAENGASGSGKLKTAFSAFMQRNSSQDARQPTAAEREALFEQFLKWQKSRP